MTIYCTLLQLDIRRQTFTKIVVLSTHNSTPVNILSGWGEIFCGVGWGRVGRFGDRASNNFCLKKNYLKKQKLPGKNSPGKFWPVGWGSDWASIHLKKRKNSTCEPTRFRLIHTLYHFSTAPIPLIHTLSRSTSTNQNRSQTVKTKHQTVIKPSKITTESSKPSTKITKTTTIVRDLPKY